MSGLLHATAPGNLAHTDVDVDVRQHPPLLYQRHLLACHSATLQSHAAFTFVTIRLTIDVSWSPSVAKQAKPTAPPPFPSQAKPRQSTASSLVHERRELTAKETATMAGARNIIPLVILFVVVAGASYIGYQLYLWSNELAERGKKKMEKKNIAFGPDGGLRVGVKEMKTDDYAAKTQKYVPRSERLAGDELPLD